MKHSVGCPVCATHTQKDALESEALVLSAVEALFRADGEQILAIQASLMPYDFHSAVGLYAKSILDICNLVEVTPAETLKQYRLRINEALSKAQK